jgi:hypothetical protein
VTAPSQEELDQVGRWIRSEAASRTVDGIYEFALEQVNTLIHVSESFASDQFSAKRTGDDWTVMDAFRHVVEWNCQVGEDVLYVSLTGERPANPPPTLPADRETLIAKQRESIESVYAHVSAADPVAFPDVVWEHPFFGLMNWREWLLFIGVHCIDHRRQIERLAALPHA